MAALHWFRHNQRLRDNPALMAAMEGCTKLYPVFVWDDFSGGLKSAGYNRVSFIHDSLLDLDEQLKQFGGRLIILRGEPEVVLKTAIQAWDIKKITVEHDLEPIWGARDGRVRALCDNLGVVWEEHVSLTLYDENTIMDNNSGNPPCNFDVFKYIVELCGQPKFPLPGPTFANTTLVIPPQYDKLFKLPSIAELGHKPDPKVNKVYKGGETEALKKLESRLELEISGFKKDTILVTLNKPNLTGPPMSLSPYLRNGCLSIATFYHALRDAYKKLYNKEAPFELTEHLIWRDFFYILSVKTPKYDKMVGNPLCLQIDWYQDEEKVDKWKTGKTGFPWIDACMRQLYQEGWIHHVCRHAVTCFLTRGDLWCHWEIGLEHFEKYLLDADWSVCAGNWIWVSSSAFEDQLQCARCYSPILYGACMDPSGAYVRKYVPELKHLPLKYLYSPWKAPLEVQKEAGCLIGQHYPAPMVDHARAWKQCTEKMNIVKQKHSAEQMKDLCHPSNSDEALASAFLQLMGKKEKECSADETCDKIAINPIFF